VCTLREAGGRGGRTGAGRRPGGRARRRADDGAALAPAQEPAEERAGGGAAGPAAYRAAAGVLAPGLELVGRDGPGHVVLGAAHEELGRVKVSVPSPTCATSSTMGVPAGMVAPSSPVTSASTVVLTRSPGCARLVHTRSRATRVSAVPAGTLGTGRAATVGVGRGAGAGAGVGPAAAARRQAQRRAGRPGARGRRSPGVRTATAGRTTTGAVESAGGATAGTGVGRSAVSARAAGASGACWARVSSRALSAAVGRSLGAAHALAATITRRLERTGGIGIRWCMGGRDGPNAR
jgi:hypothetical protein